MKLTHKYEACLLFENDLDVPDVNVVVEADWDGDPRLPKIEIKSVALVDQSYIDGFNKDSRADGYPELGANVGENVLARLEKAALLSVQEEISGELWRLASEEPWEVYDE